MPGRANRKLVSFNAHYSGSRLAALAVAQGATAAIGFQTDFDDSLTELFFANFYRSWKLSDWDRCDGTLDGWTIVESGGTGAGQGGVTLEDSDLVMREGNSFVVALQRQVVIPETPSILTFDYSGIFDTTDPDFINDA